MENQVIYLQKQGFAAVAFNSNTDYDERREIINNLEEDPSSIEFLFVTPEMFVSNDFLKPVLKNMLENGDITLVVVDEAHSIRDKIEFRPDLAVLGDLRSKYINVQWVALTTVSLRMLPTIVESLQMDLKSLKFIKAPVVRENIFYDVCLSKDLANSLVKSIHEFSNHTKEISGIIYVDRVEDAESFAKFLEHSENMSAESYFAEKPDRFEVQKKWMNRQISFLVATTESFGFGIMRENLTFVIHLCSPKNMRAFYQESGRAGGEGQMSFSRIISRGASYEMNGYLVTKQCRRRYICNIFNEDVPDCVSKCDNCLDKYEKKE